MSNFYAFSKIKKSIEYNLCSLEMRKYRVNCKKRKNV